MSSIGSGALRTQVRIEREMPQAQGGGSYNANWGLLDNAWAHIEPLSGHEFLRGERLESRVTHRVVLRYRGDITAGMRIVWGAHIMSIQTVVNLGARNRFTQLLVSDGGAT